MRNRKPNPNDLTKLPPAHVLWARVELGDLRTRFQIAQSAGLVVAAAALKREIRFRESKPVEAAT